MFHISTSSFGKFERFRLAHSSTGHGIDFVPARGGCLVGLQLGGTEILDGYQTPEELDFNKWGKSGLLYPFPNRLKDGQFTWKGEKYQFPINDAFTGNALHGFGMERPLEIIEQRLSENFGLVKMKGQYDGSLPYYPWPFTIWVTYILSIENGFEINFSLQNDSTEDIPVGLGWHPYFQLGTNIETHSLQFPELDLVGIDQRMIPTGKRYAYDDFETGKVIGSTVLDNCFAVKTQGTKLSVKLKDKNGQLTYWQETGEGKFNFLQIFTPPYRKSIALEPMSCNVDGLNNGDGLMILKPSEVFSAKAGVRFY